MVNWCGYYYNIFSSSDDDKPPEDIWDKDVLLDEWVEFQQFKRKNARKSSITSADEQADTFEAI